MVVGGAQNVEEETKNGGVIEKGQIGVIEKA